LPLDGSRADQLHWKLQKNEEIFNVVKLDLSVDIRHPYSDLEELRLKVKENHESTYDVGVFPEEQVVTVSEGLGVISAHQKNEESEEEDEEDQEVTDEPSLQKRTPQRSSKTNFYCRLLIYF
jgi:hypothetical protein